MSAAGSAGEDGQRTPATPGPGRTGRLVLAVLCALAAAGLARQLGEPPRDTIWQAPGLVRLEAAEGESTHRDLSLDRGRLRARRDLDAVLAWIPGPRRLALREPSPGVQLVLGEREGPGLVVSVRDQRLGWRTIGAPDDVDGGVPGITPTELSLAWDEPGGAWLLTADDVLLATLPGAHLPDDVLGRVGFDQGASVAGLSVSTASGQERRVDPSRESSGGAPWSAGLVGALAGLSAAGWWGLWRRRRPVDGLDRLTAGALGLALLLGPAQALVERNRERLTAPVPSSPEEPVAVAGPLELVPGRPLDLVRRDADARLAMTLELAPDTVVDVITRRDGPRSVIACLSTAADVASGVVWNRGDRLDLVPAPEALGRLPAGEPLALRVDGTGPEVRVRVDERVLGRVWDWDLRAGTTAVHVLRGRAVLRDLSLASLGEAEDTSPHLLRWRLGLWLVVGAALVLLASLSTPGRAPLAWLWAWPLLVTGLPWAADVLAVPAAALALLALALAAPGGWRRPVSLAVGAGLCLALAWAARERPHQLATHELSLLFPADIEGGPYPERLLWARHPLSRRFHPFVDEQAFRGRRVPERRADLRLAAVGGSSTFGYGVEGPRAWPAALESRLVKDGYDAQVLNAGVPGSTVWRLVSFVEELLLTLDLDVLIVSVGFNDHTVGAVWREAEHLAAMTDGGIGPLQGALARWRQDRRQEDWNAVSRRLLDGEVLDRETLEAHCDGPAARFAEGLARLVAACRERGVTPVLVQEPCRGGGDRPLLAPYRRAVADLAREQNLLLIEPQPAMDAEGGEGLFLDTVHPTAGGHWIEAREVAEALASAGLLGR